MNILWFKRDLRIRDNEALAKASEMGPVLPLYILEPELWNQPDLSKRHYEFLTTCLVELDQALRTLGQKLIIRIGNSIEILEEFNQRYRIQSLWSHQETWNAWTYERDKVIKQWCKTHNIPWYQPEQNGVKRLLKDRIGWTEDWYNQMKRPTHDAPTKLKYLEERSESLVTALELGLQEDYVTNVQKGGRNEGLNILKTFLYERGEGYTREMSSPLTAFESCSRLSSHLAFGTLSSREVFQACNRRLKEINKVPHYLKTGWPKTINSFSKRLRWRSHFIQKFECEPRIEFENLHPAYNSLRKNNFNEDYFKAWKAGMTGYPMVDSCMRALTSTGWLNFRMRAMLMSFASYHLWLDWRRPSLHLANLFTDYEPGIHYNQVQMQSGTTGVNAIRIYNPTKQGIDQDPKGIFIRRWLPELCNMDLAFIHTPWKVQSQMNGYPMPIIDEKTSRRAAADKLFGLRKDSNSHRSKVQEILSRHGNLRLSLLNLGRKKKKKNIAQKEFSL